jgi:hypothetical protein
MAKAISSPNSFKTCYIAEVKEELGLLERKLKKERKIKAPQKYKRYIRMAIESLGRNATYKEIQREAFRLYQEEKKKERSSKVAKYFGVFRADKEVVLKLAQDKDICYEG